ncbi:MAG: hypothetical protein ACKV22_24065 [Bryobacteraceae bacterium]
MARNIRQRLNAILPNALKGIVAGVLKRGGATADLINGIGTAFSRLFKRETKSQTHDCPPRPKPFRPPLAHNVEPQLAPAAGRDTGNPEAHSTQVQSIRTFHGFLGRLRNNDPAASRRAREVTARVTDAFGSVEPAVSDYDAADPARRVIEEAEQLMKKDAAGSPDGKEKMQSVQGMLALLARAVTIQRHMEKPPISNRIM